MASSTEITSIIAIKLVKTFIGKVMQPAEMG